MKNPTNKIILVVVSIVIIIIICVWSYRSYQIHQIRQRFLSGEDKVQIMSLVDKFIGNIVQGSTTKAYELTDKSMTISQLSDNSLKTTLSDYLSQSPDFHYYDGFYMTSGPYSGSEQFKYQTEVNLKGGVVGQMEVIAVKEPNMWKISRVQIDTPPDHIW
jgi:hypothetical protein